MKPIRGFTLIELAIVLVIVTLLIGGLAMPLSAQIQARRIAETRQTLQEAREAILGYAMTHQASALGKRHLPCPDTTGDGIEKRNLVGGECTQQAGFFPWVTLGTASQDAWGNRLMYAVNKKDAADPSTKPSFADNALGFSSSTVLANPLRICTANNCTSADVASDVVFVVFSAGPNGWGALNVNNSYLATPSGADELENKDADQVYVSRMPTKPNAANGEFDDLVTWVSRSQLIPKVCPAGSDCHP